MIRYTKTPTEIDAEELHRELINDLLVRFQEVLFLDREGSYHDNVVLAAICIRVSTEVSIRMPTGILQMYKKYLHNHGGHAYTLLFQKARKRWELATPRKQGNSFEGIAEEVVSRIVHCVQEDQLSNKK